MHESFYPAKVIRIIGVDFMVLVLFEWFADVELTVQHSQIPASKPIS